MVLGAGSIPAQGANIINLNYRRFYYEKRTKNSYYRDGLWRG
jgi:hypothetical protein